jgi:hypothetical protein
LKIRFLQDYQVRDTQGQAFKKGEIYDLTPESARHFLTRRRAEIVAVEKPKIAPEPVPEKAAGPPLEPPSGDKDLLEGKTEPVEAFTEGQRKYRRRKLSENDE